MKRLRKVNSATNSVNIPARTDVIEAADDEQEVTLDDKINDAKDDFDYIIDGISQLDTIQGNDILNRLHDSLQEFIQDVAATITEG